jgi:phosphonoacetaldehyde hydrolase
MTKPPPLKAVMLDWAGTTVDYGSRAPLEVFLEIFRHMEIEITTAEARAPMGMAKREHIAAIVQCPRVASLWRARYGRDPSDADIDQMYRQFLPLQKETLQRIGSEVIPGVVKAVDELRGMGLKIASSTGYTRELMEVVMPQAARGGYAPDVMLCSDDVPAGRPAPWLNFLAAQRLNVYPMSRMLVVDDTIAGILAGLNAGSPTAAVTKTGNSLGLSEQEVMSLPSDDLNCRLAQAEGEFRSVGANFVIREVAELPSLIRSRFCVDVT